MDFDLDDDDRSIQEGMRALCVGRFPIEVVRAGELTPNVIDLGRWRELAEMGVFTLGEDGLSRRQAVLAFEELGRALVPGPLVEAAALGGVIDGVGTGERLVTVVEPAAPATVVEFPAQVALLATFAEDGIRVVERDAVELHDVERPLDALTPIGWMRGQLPPGELAGDAAAAAQARLDGLVLSAAQLVGLAAGATELATEYARQREQFGRPIGSFQAVKHLLAEMLVHAEVAKVAVHAAACALDGAGGGDPLHQARIAKLLAGEAAAFCARTGIQVHGGMGFTWEVDAQRFWKRAKVLQTKFADDAELAEAIALTL